MLSQSTLETRKYHPFLKCGCKRGESANVNHVCKPFNVEQHSELIELSKKKWDKGIQRSAQINPLTKKKFPDYTIARHKDWCDKENKGVTHFGMLPYGFNLNNLASDMFHGRSGITKMILRYIRKLVIDDYNMFDMIGTLFQSLKHWNDYFVDQWWNGDALTRLQGRHIKQFMAKYEIFVTALVDNLPGFKTDEFSKMMHAWSKVYKFLGKCNMTQTEIDQYKVDNVEFFTSAYVSFAMDNTPGDKETNYMHQLRWSVPVQIQEMFNKYGIGPGYFTMEGFEHKNKESKICVATASNHRDNVPAQSLSKMLLTFEQT